jgi:hypothetical protein
MEVGALMHPITAIVTGEGAIAKKIISEALNSIVLEKIAILRKIMSNRVHGTLAEANRMRQGRTVLIRRRIRKGKLQRNIRRSAVKGFTLRHGKITRIPVARRVHMRIVQRRAARKRKAHMQQTLRKRKLSLRKRKAYGIK